MLKTGARAAYVVAHLPADDFRKVLIPVNHAWILGALELVAFECLIFVSLNSIKNSVDFRIVIYSSLVTVQISISLARSVVRRIVVFRRYFFCNSRF